MLICGDGLLVPVAAGFWLQVSAPSILALELYKVLRPPLKLSWQWERFATAIESVEQIPMIVVENYYLGSYFF